MVHACDAAGLAPFVVLARRHQHRGVGVLVDPATMATGGGLPGRRVLFEATQVFPSRRAFEMPIRVDEQCGIALRTRPAEDEDMFIAPRAPCSLLLRLPDKGSVPNK